MSAVQEQTKKLKLNASNIKSVLINKNKTLVRLRKSKSRMLDVNMRQAKQAKVAGKMATGADVASPGLSIGMDILNMGMEFLTGIFKFIGLMMVGLVFNNLPSIIATVKPAVEATTKGVKAVWKVVSRIGSTMMRFGTWIGQLFNRGKAEKDVNKIEENNKGIEESVTELEGVIPNEKLTLDDDEGGEEDGEDTAEESDAPEKETKPSTTSTTPPSPSKSGELSKDGTSDKLVKDKPPIEETKSKTEGGDLTKITGKKKIAAAKESSKLTSRSLNLRRVIPKQKDPEIKAEWQAELNRINERQKVLQSIISGAKVTTIPKKIDPVSLGKAKPNSPTVIVIPMKETKVRTVTVNSGGGVISTGSVNPPQQSKIRNSVV